MIHPKAKKEYKKILQEKLNKEIWTFKDGIILGGLCSISLFTFLFIVSIYPSTDCSSIIYGDYIISTNGFYANNISMTVVGYNDTHWKTREPFGFENQSVWILKNESKEWRCKQNE